MSFFCPTMSSFLKLSSFVILLMSYFLDCQLNTQKKLKKRLTIKKTRYINYM